MKKGDIVEIINQTPSGRQFIEGNAKLIRPYGLKDEPGGEWWYVRFEGESAEYPRFVTNETRTGKKKS